MTDIDAATTEATVSKSRAAIGGISARPSEKNADLQTTEGRIEWFCAHFEIEPPKLQYDDDEPDQIVLTDDLLKWIGREGVNMDWAFCGSISGALAVHREKYRVTPEQEEWAELLEKFDAHELSIVLAGLKQAKEPGISMDSAMRSVSEQIKAYRSNDSEAVAN